MIMNSIPRFSSSFSDEKYEKYNKYVSNFTIKIKH